jgi:hypothetical protein
MAVRADAAIKKPLSLNSDPGASGRDRNAGKTTARIAVKAGVSRYKVEQAARVEKASPELAEKVKTGQLPLRKAVKALPGGSPKKEQPFRFRGLSGACYPGLRRALEGCPNASRPQLYRELIAFLDGEFNKVS